MTDERLTPERIADLRRIADNADDISIRTDAGPDVHADWDGACRRVAEVRETILALIDERDKLAAQVAINEGRRYPPIQLLDAPVLLRGESIEQPTGTGADNPGEPVTNVLRSDHDPKCHLLNYGAGPGVCDCGWTVEYNERLTMSKLAVVDALRAGLERVIAERGLLIACDVCAEVLTEPGALVFGPPDTEGRTLKKHVCVRCLPLLSVLTAPREVKT